jgi:hypothetical protein
MLDALRTLILAPNPTILTVPDALAFQSGAAWQTLTPYGL